MDARTLRLKSLTLRDAEPVLFIDHHQLEVLESDFVLKQSLHFAYRLRRERGNDVAAQVQRAWQLAFLRDPTPAELQQATEFINQRTAKLTTQTPPDPDASLNPFVSLCQILLSSNEFLYVE